MDGIAQAVPRRGQFLENLPELHLEIQQLAGRGVRLAIARPGIAQHPAQGVLGAQQHVDLGPDEPQAAKAIAQAVLQQELVLRAERGRTRGVGGVGLGPPLPDEMADGQVVIGSGVEADGGGGQGGEVVGGGGHLQAMIAAVGHAVAGDQLVEAELPPDGGVERLRAAAHGGHVVLEYPA